MITDNMRVMLNDPRGLDIVKSYLGAIEAHDVAALKRLMRPDVVLTHANYPAVHGRDGAVDMIEGYLDIIRSVEFEVRTLFGDKGFFAIEKINIAEGAKGGTAYIRVVTILEVGEDDLISSVRIYAETADLFRRLENSQLARGT